MQTKSILHKGEKSKINNRIKCTAIDDETTSLQF